VVAEAGKRDPALACGREHGRLVRARRQQRHQVEPRGDTCGLPVGQLGGERGNERVAAATVDTTGTAQVAIELAALEEVGKRELLDDRRAEVVALLRGHEVRGDALGRHHPAEPQPRRERLRHRPGVEDPFGCEPLERADGGAVVPVFGVVVILEQEHVRRGRPLGEPRPARG
jgi:hypothetical protein